MKEQIKKINELLTTIKSQVDWLVEEYKERIENEEETAND